MDSTTFIDPPQPGWLVTWQSGPDAGGRRVLGPGRYVVGRAPTADIRCDDPQLDRHDGMLEIDHDGSIGYRSFATGVRTTVGPEGLQLGSSTLAIQHELPLPDERASLLDGALIRRPRVVPRFEPTEVPPLPPAPPDTERPGGLLPAALGLAGAAAMALVLHQPMFLVFGMVGASVAAGSWITQWLAGRRRNRRAAADQGRAVAVRTAVVADNRAAFLAWHCARVPTLHAALAAAAARSATLWTRRTDHPDAFLVSIGNAAAIADDGSPLGDLPVATLLGDGDRLAVIGDDSRAMARALIAQLTATCGPADLRVVIVTDRPAGWESLGSLPHLVLPDVTASIVDEAGLGAALELLGHRERTHLVVVTDCARALATRTGPLRRLLATSKVALLAALDRDDGVPHLCTAVLTTQSGSGWWTGDTSSTAPATRLRTAGLGTVAATAHARSLALLRDPEDGIADDARLPRHVGFLTMIEPLGARPAHEIAERWHAAAHRPPRTPVGVAADGFVDIDLVRDGPHGLLAGTTGSGKSELLRTLVAGLALHTPPCRLAIVLVDYKGGATFDALVRLPHVVGVVTDLDGQLADRALRSLHAELRRREAVLREHGVADVSTLHERCPDARLPRLLVVIDEFAALVAEQPDFLHALVGVAQRGRSLGVHLLLATQRPNGVISDDIRANTDLRIALRLLDRSDAIDVVGDATPSMLPRTIPGRGVLRLADEHVTFQTAHLSQHDIGELVDRIVEADALTGEATPDAPWLPPLPRRLRPLDLPPGAIGMFDDPDHQTRTPLRWKAADGDVLVCGSSGTGRSSALQLLTGAALAEPDTHVYILHADAGCTALPDDHPRALRIHVADQERVVRLLHRLRETASTGRADASHVRTVLVVDDLDVVRRTLADPERSDEYDDLDDVLAAVDIRLVVSASRANGVPANVIARCAIRWVLHLHDPHDGGVLGVAATSNPPAIPGRAHVVPHGLEAQLALPSRGAAISRSERDAGVVSIRPIDPVAAVVHADTLLTAAHPGGPYEADGNVLPLGLDVASGATATLEVPDGEHVLVLGGARSGRSTTLTRFVLAWRTLHPHGTVVAVLPRRSSLDRRHVDRVLHVGELGDLRLLAQPTDAVAEHVLVVVDDAELVDDPDGLLGTLAGSRRPGLMIIAAARPDAIRQTYGHWTGVVRRSRLGVVATGGSDTDGDVLGVVLPRRAPLRPRPGLMWVIDRGRAALTQVAIDTPTNVDELRAAN